MSQTITNPFIVNGEIPDAYFCDRQEETTRLLEHIQNRRNVLLTSPRRMGKTGLIAHTFQKKEIQDVYYTFFVDILQTSSLRELTYAFGQQIFETLKPMSKKMTDLFLQTVRSISGAFGFDPVTSMPTFNLSLGAIQNPEYTLEEIFRYINLADKPCLIAIDEFQQITRYGEKNIEALLRHHIQHSKNAIFIFAGSERHILDEMFNSYARPFYASTTPLSLEKIPQPTYSAFVNEHFREFGKEVKDEAIAYAYNLFGGNTYCIQRTFNQAFGKTPQGAICELDDVLKAIDTILLEQEHTYRLRLSMLTPSPKELLIAIAKDGAAEHLTSGAFIRKHHLSSTSSVQSAVKQLLAEDWITFHANDSGQRTYSLTDPFLTLWIRKYFG